MEAEQLDATGLEPHLRSHTSLQAPATGSTNPTGKALGAACTPERGGIIVQAGCWPSKSVEKEGFLLGTPWNSAQGTM